MNEQNAFNDRPMNINVPSLEEVMEAEAEGYGIATDGCRDIEPDGTCQHGCDSWLVVWGMI